jgi:hypothetical protein
MNFSFSVIFATGFEGEEFFNPLRKFWDSLFGSFLGFGMKFGVVDLEVSMGEDAPEFN